MRNGVIAAWLVGEGIITYRCVRNQHRPPLPGQLLASSGLFVLLALLEGPQPQLANLVAWGLDIAAVLNLFGNAAPGSSIGAALAGPATSTGTPPSTAHPSSTTTSPQTAPSGRAPAPSGNSIPA